MCENVCMQISVRHEYVSVQLVYVCVQRNEKRHKQNGRGRERGGGRGVRGGVSERKKKKRFKCKHYLLNENGNAMDMVILSYHRSYFLINCPSSMSNNVMLIIIFELKK